MGLQVHWFVTSWMKILPHAEPSSSYDMQLLPGANGDLPESGVYPARLSADLDAARWEEWRVAGQAICCCCLRKRFPLPILRGLMVAAARCDQINATWHGVRRCWSPPFGTSGTELHWRCAVAIWCQGETATDVSGRHPTSGVQIAWGPKCHTCTLGLVGRTWSTVPGADAHSPPTRWHRYINIKVE